MMRILAVVAFLLATFTVVSSAEADVPRGAVEAVEDQRLLAGQPNGSFVVEVGPTVMPERVIYLFGARYKTATGQPLTWEILHAANPDRVFPICRNDGDGINVNLSRSGDTSVWASCTGSTHHRGIALKAGRTGRLLIPMSVPETYEQRQTRLVEQDTCFKSADCLKKQLEKLEGKSASHDAPAAKGDAKTAKPKGDEPKESSEVSELETLRTANATLKTENDTLATQNATLRKENVALKNQGPSYWPYGLAVIALALGFASGRANGRRREFARNANPASLNAKQERPTMPSRRLKQTETNTSPSAADQQLVRYQARIIELERELTEKQQRIGALEQDLSTARAARSTPETSSVAYVEDSKVVHLASRRAAAGGAIVHSTTYDDDDPDGLMKTRTGTEDASTGAMYKQATKKLKAERDALKTLLESVRARFTKAIEAARHWKVEAKRLEDEVSAASKMSSQIVTDTLNKVRAYDELAPQLERLKANDGFLQNLRNAWFLYQRSCHDYDYGSESLRSLDQGSRELDLESVERLRSEARMEMAGLSQKWPEFLEALTLALDTMPDQINDLVRPEPRLAPKHDVPPPHEDLDEDERTMVMGRPQFEDRLAAKTGSKSRRTLVAVLRELREFLSGTGRPRPYVVSRRILPHIRDILNVEAVFSTKLLAAFEDKLTDETRDIFSEPQPLYRLYGAYMALFPPSVKTLAPPRAH